MRSRVAPVCLSLILLVGCTSKGEHPKDEAEPATDASAPAVAGPPPIGSRVLIREARGLATEPKPDAKRLVGDGIELRIAEVVAHVGEFVELRTITDRPYQVCSADGMSEKVELRFFARPEELEPVLASAKQVELDDGSKLAFAPGVPIEGEGADARLHVGEARFEVPLADHEIARWFRPGPLEEHWGTLEVPREHTLAYGGKPLGDTREGPFEFAYQARPIDGGGTLLSFADACGQFTLRTDATLPERTPGAYPMKGPKEAIPQMARQFDPDMAARHAGILGTMEASGRVEVDVWGGLPACEPGVWLTMPAGTELAWRETGTPAGKTREESSLPRDVAEVDGKYCFDITGLGVCVASSAVSREERDCELDDDGGLELIPKDSSAGFGDRGGKPLEVTQAKAEIVGHLDHDIIRRIIRAHLNEVRSCYSAGLDDDPKLAGRVSIRFVIGASGKVQSSEVRDDQLEPADPSVGICLAKAFKRWTFPKVPGGGTVSVVQPFELEPG